jgi:hypothetical protein
MEKVVTFANGHSVRYDLLINTMPIKEIVKKIKGCPDEIHTASRDLHHTEGMFVGIGVADPCPSTKCWMYFPESDSPFYRITYLSNYSPKMTPPGPHFSLLAEVSDSPFKCENSDDVVDRTIKGMVSSQLLTPEQAKHKIVSQQLLRVPYSYPVPTIGRDRALAKIHPWFTQHGIYSRGRFGAWRYEIGNSDHSVMQGVEVADFLVHNTPERTWALLPGEEAKARPSIWDFQGSDRSSWHARHKRPLWNVLCHHRSGRDNRVVTNCHPGEDRCRAANPDVHTQAHRRDPDRARGFEPMVVGIEDGDEVSNQTIIAYNYAMGGDDGGTGIDEDSFAKHKSAALGGSHFNRHRLAAQK